jgi:hypothetical protein
MRIFVLWCLDPQATAFPIMSIFLFAVASTYDIIYFTGGHLRYLLCPAITQFLRDPKLCLTCFAKELVSTCGGGGVMN